jgi:hypothetical protein
MLQMQYLACQIANQHAWSFNISCEEPMQQDFLNIMIHVNSQCLRVNFDHSLIVIPSLFLIAGLFVVFFLLHFLEARTVGLALIRRFRRWDFLSIACALVGAALCCLGYSEASARQDKIVARYHYGKIQLKGDSV